MIALIVLFVLLLFVLILAMPVIVTASIRFSPVGGVIHGTVTLLGSLSIPVRLRVRIFSEPFLTVQLFQKRIPLNLKNSGYRLNPRSYRAEQIRLCVTLGVSNDGAKTVQLLGTVQVFASLLLPLLFRAVKVIPYPAFSHEMFRMKAEVIGLVFPLFLFFPKRIKKKEPANDNAKQYCKERYSNVTC